MVLAVTYRNSSLGGTDYKHENITTTDWVWFGVTYDGYLGVLTVYSDGDVSQCTCVTGVNLCCVCMCPCGCVSACMCPSMCVCVHVCVCPRKHSLCDEILSLTSAYRGLLPSTLVTEPIP